MDISPHRDIPPSSAEQLGDEPESGLVAVEYGLIVAAFGALIVLLFLIGDDLGVLFNAIADSIAE